MPTDIDDTTKAVPNNRSEEPPSTDSSDPRCNASLDPHDSVTLSPDSECHLSPIIPDSLRPMPNNSHDSTRYHSAIVDEVDCSGQEYEPVSHTREEQTVPDPGKEVTAPNDYGVGVDVHRDFIYVTVLLKREGKIFLYENTFNTTMPSLKEAKAWCVSIIEKNSNPTIKVDALSYTCESTASYHFPLLDIWGGNPAIVNPTLAKSGRRKTDRLDSRKLAEFDLGGTWPRSFVIPTEIHELRSLIREMDYYKSLATRINNRIINTLARFGCTISREGSVTKDGDLRILLEGMLTNSPVFPDEFCAMEIPPSMRDMLSESLISYDWYIEQASSYMDKVEAKAYDIQWEVGEKGHMISGEEAIQLLTTAPQVGEYTAIVFLANVITPFRFSNAKAMAAYCGLDPSIQTSANKKTSGKGRGGNKTLHYLLEAAANRLLSTHSEMFGEWGYRLTLKGTSRNKARNAIARKLCVAMYYMLLYQKPFSYDKYTLTQGMVYLDISLEELVKLESGFKRYIRILNLIDIQTTGELIHAYVTCSLDHVDGLGPKFFRLMRHLLDNQKDYRSKYKELKEKTSKEEGES